MCIQISTGFYTKIVLENLSYFTDSAVILRVGVISPDVDSNAISD
jgi:hypothetical protein